ncbi:Cytochrome P450 71B29, partial [Bienertia sinuspersici]
IQLYQLQQLKPRANKNKAQEENVFPPSNSSKPSFVPTIVVSLAKLAKEVLKIQDHVFCSRSSFIAQQKLSYNGSDLAFTPYNEYWKKMKKISVTHLFNAKKESKLVHLSELAMTLTNSIICRIGFGKNYNDDESSTILFLATTLLLFLPSKSSNTNNKFEKTPFKLVSRPPSSKGLPIIANLHQFNPINTYLYFFQLPKIYGPLIYLKLGFVPTIVVSSAKLAREVLKTQDHVFCSRPSIVGQKNCLTTAWTWLLHPTVTIGEKRRKFGSLISLA